MVCWPLSYCTMYHHLWVYHSRTSLVSSISKSIFNLLFFYSPNMPSFYLCIKKMFFKVRIASISKTSLLLTNTPQSTHTTTTIKDISWGYSHLKTWLRLKDLLLKSLMWLLARGLGSSPQGFLHLLPEFPHDMSADFLLSKKSKREQGRHLSAFSDPVSEMYNITFTFFYLLGVSIQVLPTLKERGISLHHLKGRISKNLWTYLKTTIATLAVYKQALISSVGRQRNWGPGPRLNGQNSQTPKMDKFPTNVGLLYQGQGPVGKKMDGVI